MQRIEITATKFYDRAVECFREKDYDNALKHINEAIKKYEKNPRFHYFYGFICQTIKDLHQAERSFLRCLDLDPKNDECLWNLSMIYFEEKKILEALKMWQLITDFKPEDLEARINTGLAYYQMSELAMAVQAFQAVLKIDPDNFEAHKNLALINKEQKNFEASMMHLARLPIIDSTYEEVVEKEMAAVESL